ncbi:MAG: hypothetical protein ABIL09_13340 [Gemmatimonadota bacterium]
MRWRLALCLLALCGSAGWAGPRPAAPPAPVDGEQAAEWLDHLLPLPRQVAFEGQVGVPPGGVAVRSRPGASPAELHAAADLQTLLGAPSAAGFEILQCRLDGEGRAGGLDLSAAAAHLRSRPNPDQAYAIVPQPPDRLVAVALGDQGVWNAAQTLRQLLSWQPCAGAVTVPLVRVLDWPALAQRGLWDDTFSAAQIEWMARLKLNRVDCHTRLGLDAAGEGVVAALPVSGPQQMDGLSVPEYCRRRGLEYVPIITHLSHLDRTGLYDRYPELRGRGEAAGRRFIAPCASQPRFADVLAQWMAALAARPQVGQVAVWLSEETERCECDLCRATPQHVLEARAIAAAYGEVRAAHPDLRLWVLLSQGSYPVNDQVLAALPPEVGVIYYHGIRTYDSSREPMIYYGLREAAARGRPMGVCPQLTASWAVVCPWSGPQFVRARMGEFAAKGLSLVSGYATPDIRLYAFNAAAAAEWAWNPEGRDEAGFARAWATHQGYRDPEAAARWAVELGEVSWDVYGSLIPYHFIPQWGDAARTVENRVRPILGEGMFRYFATPARFDADLATCDRALELARGLGEPVLVEEALVVQGYVRMVRAIYRMADGVWQRGAPLDVAALRRDRADLADAGEQTNAALRRWEAAVGPGLGGGRFAGTLELTDGIVARIGAAVDSLTREQERGGG